MRRAGQPNTKTSEKGTALNELSEEKLALLHAITAEHLAMKQRVQWLQKQRSVTSAEKREITELKKRKLLIKDRIQSIQR